MATLLQRPQRTGPAAGEHGRRGSAGLPSVAGVSAESRQPEDTVARTLPSPPIADPVLDRLFAERIVYLAGEIDDEAAHRITAQLLLLTADDAGRDISFYLNSPGGSVTAGMAIYDTMQLVPPDVATWAVGFAASTAQLLLTAGAPGKRYALPHARILLHQPSARLGGTASDVTIRAAVFTEMKREVAELTARHAGQPVETIVADADRDRWFDAEQARAYGLVDHVAGPASTPVPQRRVGFLGEGPGNSPR
jgi:ATP-dependent Clp protease, protease subunit